MKKQIFKDWSNIAHRGLHDEKIPENSMKAFSKAIKNNYVIELDIHLLKDNNVVVFHDDNLKRMTNKNINIKDMTYEEIKKINLKQTDEKIPLLKDVLKLVDKNYQKKCLLFFNMSDIIFLGLDTTNFLV